MTILCTTTCGNTDCSYNENHPYMKEWLNNPMGGVIKKSGKALCGLIHYVQVKKPKPVLNIPFDSSEEEKNANYES